MERQPDRDRIAEEAVGQRSSNEAAEGAGCGVVVDDGRIVELVACGAEPAH